MFNIEGFIFGTLVGWTLMSLVFIWGLSKKIVELEKERKEINDQMRAVNQNLLSAFTDIYEEIQEEDKKERRQKSSTEYV